MIGNQNIMKKMYLNLIYFIILQTCQSYQHFLSGTDKQE